ncbi:MAG: hypothetical protein AB3N33_01050 [Puniceicoccaceae bacterium]
MSAKIDSLSDAGGMDLQVSTETRKIPEIVNRLNDWQYLERSIHRILAGWGRHQSSWDDKVALHRHVWDQAEVVRRLRERVGEFPGGKPDGPVSPELETVSNVVLLAPSFEDALDGVYHLLLQALIRAYVAYVQNAHPVHDAPTIALLHEVNTIKEQHFFWYREYRREHPHTTDAVYKQGVLDAIESAGGFLQAIPFKGKEGARPCGGDSDFRTPKYSSRPANWRCEHDITPFIRVNFESDMEARRLYWAMGYMREMNLPDDQLNWLFWGHYMPWEWHHDISRHLWDESRHGHSGYSRLKDWGLDLQDVGFTPYNNDVLIEAYVENQRSEGKPATTVSQPDLDFTLADEPMTPKDLYEAVFFIGMVAENGHFIVKNEGYEDFRDAEDLESAEMMLFDIIDETTHVQYAHRWLSELAEHAGISNEGYRERASAIRKELEADEQKRAEEDKALLVPGNPAYEHYLALIERIREAAPLKGDVERHRSRKPM